MEKTGLVLEGGGMRGLFTIGVLDAFLERDLQFDCCLGVSAGATHGASFVSRQKGRNRQVMLDFINDSRYFGIKNLLREGNIFGTEFAYNEVPYQLVPFDFERFNRSPMTFEVGVTDCETGEGVFLDHREYQEEILEVLRASCSLPFLSQPVQVRGRMYLDGGISQPIPVARAREKGCTTLVVVLTQPEGYRKEPSLAMALSRLVYRRYPQLVETMENRHRQYNAVLESIEEQAREGKIFLIRPEGGTSVGRLERDTRKLEQLYQEGLTAGRNGLPALMDFLQERTA